MSKSILEQIKLNEEAAVSSGATSANSLSNDNDSKTIQKFEIKKNEMATDSETDFDSSTDDSSSSESDEDESIENNQKCKEAVYDNVNQIENKEGVQMNEDEFNLSDSTRSTTSTANTSSTSDSSNESASSTSSSSIEPETGSVQIASKTEQLPEEVFNEVINCIVEEVERNHEENRKRLNSRENSMETE